MRDVARPACVGLAHALERHLAPVHEATELADLPLHVVDALGPHLSDHLAGAREVGVEAEEVDAVFEREDLRLAIQAQAQRLDVLLDPLEDLRRVQGKGSLIFFAHFRFLQTSIWRTRQANGLFIYEACPAMFHQAFGPFGIGRFQQVPLPVDDAHCFFQWVSSPPRRVSPGASRAPGSSPFRI